MQYSHDRLYEVSGLNVGCASDVMRLTLLLWTYLQRTRKTYEVLETFG